MKSDHDRAVKGVEYAIKHFPPSRGVVFMLTQNQPYRHFYLNSVLERA